MHACSLHADTFFPHIQPTDRLSCVCPVMWVRYAHDVITFLPLHGMCLGPKAQPHKHTHTHTLQQPCTSCTFIHPLLRVRQTRDTRLAGPIDPQALANILIENEHLLRLCR